MRPHAATLVLLPLASALAQGTSYQIAARGGGPALMAVRSVCPTPSSQCGGYGFLWVELESHTRSELRLRIKTRTAYRTGFEARRSLVLEPGRSTRICLPVLGEDPVFSVEGEAAGESFVDHRAIGNRANIHGLAVLHVGSDGATASDWKTVLSGEVLPAAASPPRGARAAAIALPVVGVEDLPPDARWLSGYDLILLDAGLAGLTGEHQERLVQYVAAGGALLLYHGEALPPGPLLAMAAATGPGRHGLGTWLRIEGGSDDAAAQKLGAWLGHRTVGPLLATKLPLGAPARSGLYVLLRIPGLGQVPVWGFLLLIAGFVAFVARQLLGVLRRRLRPMRMLVTLPTTGVTFALLILGYGLFSEGFSIRGTMWSFSRLDQNRHEVVAVDTRTYFAGLAPSHLTPAPGTLVLSRPHPPRNRRDAELRVDLDRGARIDGAALPSRTAVSLVTTSVTRARERLRFRRRTDGALEVLAGPELKPLGHADAVVLRDFSGTTFRQQSPGLLTTAPGDAAKVIAAACASLPGMPWTGAPVMNSPQPGGQAWITDWMEGQIGELAPGSYLAWVESPPAFDTLGLDVEFAGSVHLVLGTLAPEDILE